jgi:hypothetical protein
LVTIGSISWNTFLRVGRLRGLGRSVLTSVLLINRHATHGLPR